MARTYWVFWDARPSAVHHAEFDHSRRATFVSCLAIGADRFRDFAVGSIGATELIERTPRVRRCDLAELNRYRDVGRRDNRDAFDVRRLVKVCGIGGHAGAKHKNTGLSGQPKKR